MWGSNPKFEVRGELSFARCEAEYKENKQGHWNISAQRDSRSNYNVKQRVRSTGEEGYALVMYSTDIITWWAEGDIEYQNHPTHITQTVMNHFGPIRIWKDSRSRFHHKYRWGRHEWMSRHEPHLPLGDFPFCPRYDRMVLPASGIITGLYDQRRRIKPAVKAERRNSMRMYRSHALPRILLGEFGERFATYRTSGRRVFGRVSSYNKDTGWWSQVPNQFTHNELFQQFTVNADHDDIVTILDRSQLWHLNACYENKEEAIRAAVDHIGRNALSSYPGWYETVLENYPPINWKEYT